MPVHKLENKSDKVQMRKNCKFFEKKWKIEKLKNQIRNQKMAKMENTKLLFIQFEITAMAVSVEIEIVTFSEWII